jgi:hypothetical protein
MPMVSPACTPAIEMIAYFCAAELLANAAKHSDANKIKIDMTERAGLLAPHISDDGRGGADPARDAGLSGFAEPPGSVRDLPVSGGVGSGRRLTERGDQGGDPLGMLSNFRISPWKEVAPLHS